MTVIFDNFLGQLSQDGERTRSWVAASREFFPGFIVENEILAELADTITIVLHGSTVLNIDDAHSDLDYWLVLDDVEYDTFRKKTEQSFIPLQINGKEGHMNPLRLCELEECFNGRVDMNLASELRSSVVIEDRKGVIGKYHDLSQLPLARPVQYAWFFHNYVEMRAYHRNGDNPMERNDEFATLYSVANTIKHALQAAFVLDASPYPYHKWLYAFARFHPTSRSLLAGIDVVMNEIKTNPAALLGPEAENRVSRELRIIRSKLVEEARRQGIDEPWMEKWWRYMDRSHDILNETKWTDT